jgi:hypothetical protein
VVFCVNSAQYSTRQVTDDCFFHPLIYYKAKFALLLNYMCLVNGLHSLILLHTKFTFDKFSEAWSLDNVTHYHQALWKMI